MTVVSVVDAADDVALDRAFRAVVAHGLPGCDPHDVGPPPLDDAPTWLRLLRQCELQRLTGPLVDLADRGGWILPDEHRVELERVHRRAMALALLLERDLVLIGEQLEAHDIPFRVLKGSAIAHLDEPTPEWRSFGDVDLLVRGRDLTAAGEQLAARGGHRRYAEPRPGFDAHFSKGSSFHFDHNSEVDLHRTLAAGPFGLTIDLDDLFAHHETFTLAGHPLRALDRPSRFLHAAYHAILGASTPRWAALRDLVRTAPADAAACRVVLGRVDRWQGQAVLAAAVDAARVELGWTPPVELAHWAAWFRPTARDRRWLDAYRGGHRSYAAQMINGLEAVPGARDKLAYAVALAAPSAAPGRAPLTTRWARGLRALPRTLRP